MPPRLTLAADLRDGAEQHAAALERLARHPSLSALEQSELTYIAAFVRVLVSRQIECALDRDAEATRAMGFTPLGHRRI